MQCNAIPCIINNCWRSVPLPCGQYNGHFYRLYLCRVTPVHCYQLYSHPHPPITLCSVEAGTNSLVCNRNLSASRWKFCHCKSYREHLIGGFAKTLWCLTPSPTSSGQVTKRENLKWASQLILRSNSQSVASFTSWSGWFLVSAGAEREDQGMTSAKVLFSFWR